MIFSLEERGLSSLLREKLLESCGVEMKTQWMLD
jgi:hypothetical protein